MSYHNDQPENHDELKMLRSEINRLQERLNNADDNVKLADALEEERRFLYGVILAVVVQNGGSFDINESTFQEIADSDGLEWKSGERPDGKTVTLKLKDQGNE